MMDDGWSEVYAVLFAPCIGVNQTPKSGIPNPVVSSQGVVRHIN
jgi:hypothetical protein